jgi:hypothetical protein
MPLPCFSFTFRLITISATREPFVRNRWPVGLTWIGRPLGCSSLCCVGLSALISSFDRRAGRVGSYEATLNPCAVTMAENTARHCSSSPVTSMQIGSSLWTKTDPELGERSS